MAVTTQPLARIWEAPSALAGIFATVDHKRIGVRYMVTAFTFFVLGGIEALLMRTQLIRPENTFLDPRVYDEIFTMHGTTMIFFFATPMLFGFGNFVIPLLIGARDMAFPRLNAFGYWIFLFSGLFLYSSFLFGLAPDGGWFAYTPLTGPAFSPNLNIDFWSLGLLFLGIGTTAGAINFIVTIFKLRAPGMSINRMPLFVWAILVTSFAVLFAIPSLNAANILLELDRKVGTHFFDPAAGGNPLLWQHLFWVFGHPDVYIIFLPAVGIISEIVPTFSRRPIVGYTFVALATVATGILGFGVWVHHMFATGLPQLSLSFFGAASEIIAIPSGIQVFAWLFTILRGKPVLKVPLLYAAGFIFLFVIGGLTGVMFPATSFDRQVTDSYFVVAHFHYVLVGGAVFPMFAGIVYWFPKITGRLMNEWLGKLGFWILFIGFNLTFFPMHITGLLGMPRRTYTYPANLGWDTTNLLSTLGVYTLAIGAIVFVVNIIYSRWFGEAAGDDPWRGNTLEWATSSPPPPFNFRTIPTVRSANPLWEQRDLAQTVRSTQVARDQVTDPSDPFKRESLGTTLLDAKIEEIIRFPEDSYWPLVLAVGISMVFVGLLVNQLALALVGIVVVIGSIIAWLAPRKEERHERE